MKVLPLSVSAFLLKDGAASRSQQPGGVTVTAGLGSPHVADLPKMVPEKTARSRRAAPRKIENAVHQRKHHSKRCRIPAVSVQGPGMPLQTGVQLVLVSVLATRFRSSHPGRDPQRQFIGGVVSCAPSMSTFPRVDLQPYNSRRG